MSQEDIEILPASNLDYFIKETNPNGRPPKYDTPEKLKKKMVEYFQMCLTNNHRPLISGLCNALGFESRKSFYRLGEKEKFRHLVKRARQYIEIGAEEMLEKNPAAAMFVLVNMGWDNPKYANKEEEEENKNLPQVVKITSVIHESEHTKLNEDEENK